MGVSLRRGAAADAPVNGGTASPVLRVRKASGAGAPRAARRVFGAMLGGGTRAQLGERVGRRVCLRPPIVAWSRIIRRHFSACRVTATGRPRAVSSSQGATTCSLRSLRPCKKVEALACILAGREDPTC
jgi:hypothetical protein